MPIWKYNGKVLKTAGGGVFASEAAPAGLPAKTIRCKFSSGYTPTMGDAQTLVDVNENIWDIYKSSSEWNILFRGNTSLLEVINANADGVTNMASMFASCSNLTAAHLYNTSSTSNMIMMFSSCTSLTTVPLFDTSSVTTVRQMFRECTSVQTGALALYQQMSTQANPPTTTSQCFNNCGSNTVTGASELAQIPTTWGGTMSV